MNYNQRLCQTSIRHRYGNPYADKTVEARLINTSAQAYEKSLSMVYSPYQKWRDIYDSQTALKNGTIFSELNMPFYGYRQNGCKCGGCNR